MSLVCIQEEYPPSMLHRTASLWFAVCEDWKIWDMEWLRRTWVELGFLPVGHGAMRFVSLIYCGIATRSIFIAMNGYIGPQTAHQLPSGMRPTGLA